MNAINKEAYVYRITVNSTNKKYIGFHKLKDGEIIDNYIHSSKCPIFLKDFSKGDNNYEIIAEGTAIDMANLERKMLLEVDAKNNEEYYNKSLDRIRTVEKVAHINPNSLEDALY